VVGTLMVICVTVWDVERMSWG